MKNKRYTLTSLLAAGVLVAGLAGCANNDAGDTAEKAKDSVTSAAGEATEKAGEAAGSGEEDAASVNARPDECGLQEQEGPVASFGVFDAAVMFFQPGQMAPNPNSDMEMLDYADSQMHVELDLKANKYATNWGYSVDETPANLHIVYQIKDDSGKVMDEGMMMPMNAIDGSHYGTNLKKDLITKPGTYKLKITIYPPKDYDIHSDYITGVPAEKWFGPLTQEMDWEITQENLDAIKKNTVDDPMTPPENCKKYPKKMLEDKSSEDQLKKAEGEKPLPMANHGDHGGH